MIEVFDDIIDSELQDKIENMLMSFECPWYYHPSTVTSFDLEQNVKKYKIPYKIVENMVDTHMFVHTIVRDGEIKSPVLGPVCAKILKQFVKKTNISTDNIYRLKANLQVRDTSIEENKYNAIHIDNDEPHWVVIYYVNNSDGDTLLFDKNFQIIKKVSPKKGRILLFRGDILHASRGPRKSLNRCVLNINLQMKEGDPNGY